MSYSLNNKFISPIPLRVFTKSFASTLISLRLPLKNWEKSLAYGSYKLPFGFDRLRFLAYRVEAKSFDLDFDREQRKYFATYDLGGKKHLRISSNHYVFLQRYFSFGRITYGRSTMINFFKTLSTKGNTYLYKPFKSLARPYALFSYSWNLDALFSVLRKRFSYSRKIKTQSFDLDLLVSANSASLKTTLLSLLPTRYYSFFISSFTHNRPLRFISRYFRYFYKYNLRKNFWSHKLYVLWNRINYFPLVNPWFNPLADLSCLQICNMSFFYGYKIYVKLFSNLIFLNTYVYSASLGRLFLSYIFNSLESSGFLLLLWATFTYNNFSRAGYYPLVTNSDSTNNSLFLNSFLQRKLVIVRLVNSFSIVGRYGYYRPWRNRFAFSLRHYNFLQVFNSKNFKQKLDITSRKSFSKNIYKRDWFIYDAYHVAQRRARKLFGRYILMFLGKQSHSIDLFAKLPLFLKGFFKFSRRFFPGISLNYTDAIYNNSVSSKLYMPHKRTLDSSDASLYLLEKNALHISKLLLERIATKKNALALSFLQYLTRKEILHLMRALRLFSDTSLKLTSKTRYFFSRWWVNYPLAKKINPAYSQFNNFSFFKQGFQRGISQLRSLAKLMRWQFTPSQISEELTYLMSRLNISKILKQKKKKWVPAAVFQLKVMLVRLLRSQPFILKWFFNSLRLFIGRLTNINKHFLRHLTSFSYFNVSSFAYWFRRWNKRFMRNIITKALALKYFHQWDFSYLSSLGLSQLYSGLLSQRMFFILANNANVVRDLAVSLKNVQRKRWRTLPSKLLTVLRSFQKNQSVLKYFSQKKAKMVSGAKNHKHSSPINSKANKALGEKHPKFLRRGYVKKNFQNN